MKRPRWSANTWVLVILGGVIALAMIDMGRRIMAANRDEAAPTGHATASYVPNFKVGEHAPNFTLNDAAGKPHQAAELVKGDTLLCFICGCSACKDYQLYMSRLLPMMGKKRPRVVAVSTTDPIAEEAMIRDVRLKQKVLYEPRDTVGGVMDMYKGHPCPRVYRMTGGTLRVSWIGPSPGFYTGQVADLGEIAYRMAENLGFRRPVGKGGSPDDDPSKPRAPLFTYTFGQAPPEVLPSPDKTNTGPLGLPSPGAAAGAFPPGHGPGDGHNH